MICARKGCDNEASMIHARRFRKRTQDWYVVMWCNDCQRKRVNVYNSQRRTKALTSAERTKRMILVDQSAAQRKRLSEKYA